MRTPGGVDGGQVHAWIAKHRPDLAHRLVFITGDIANEETVATLRETGAPCVEKPFRVQQFIDVLSKTLGKVEEGTTPARKIPAYACRLSMPGSPSASCA